jgi:hypothetical protein
MSDSPGAGNAILETQNFSGRACPQTIDSPIELV